jgi:nitrous oxidase accessory protein NosD
VHVSKGIRVVVAAVILVGGSLTFSNPASAKSDDHGKAVTVKVGESIQAALDKAPPGATVKVQAGSYAENLLITKPVKLVGKDVVLTLPPTPTYGFCAGPGFVTAICVVGDIEFFPDSPPILHHYLTGVSISGFRVTGFSGDGIYSVATDGLTLNADESDHNSSGHGVVIFLSKNPTIRHSDLHDNVFNGIFIVIGPESNATIDRNRIYNNQATGIFLNSTVGAEIGRNDIWGNCVGVAIAYLGGPDPSSGAHVRRNLIHDNNGFCPGDATTPPLSGVGVLLAGTHAAVVEENVINGHRNNPAALGGGGIVVVDSSIAGGGVPSDNQVNDNRLTDNQPDLRTDGLGANNRFTGNHCTTSVPDGLCTPLVDDGDDD